MVLFRWGKMALLILASGACCLHATTRDVRRVLEAGNAESGQRSALLLSPDVIRYRDEHQDPPPDALNPQPQPLQRGYQIVLFMQGGCHFCQQFDPQLAQLSLQTGLKVFPYTLDGLGDASFPAAIPAPQTVIEAFYGDGQPVVTPATFLVNVNTLQAWPLALGIADMPAIKQRITQILNASPD
ncbi:type-F conjugative transfer system pilin assembly thiol-disulfide isomerase TrbB [Enterobacter ludwigii]|jgi:type-F conjugative transfer system pilin assembly thiol-disulfide isomerase TrbB|uniref:type-F conjugative transfer system pilin assembly thiol-disulfide isomerase TrbB n=1 Tax=Enterobacter TaxID=547 RepID=UPI00163A2982|nr:MULTISPECIES: type-F conjugative transfer system pilin assembly thiol-disulfide isomerase TrbB [Enterobacter]MBK1520761.1 type-F conjugative transfer system pilin assembly thiol-disulfide isomerase TrbB [Enterobacter ludwigii]MDR6368651.1 type-F conjugative transfer system pilin assembly thiol-disulfide isomerase TrbB [Enterobacter sp. SORGH_AS_0287]HDU8904436.1 type-F conjugative transfer system pilin assembly thiol-disulfide isomerase TrbB [Enterobacter ludwigii]